MKRRMQIKTSYKAKPLAERTVNADEICVEKLRALCTNGVASRGKVVEAP